MSQQFRWLAAGLLIVASFLGFDLFFVLDEMISFANTNVSTVSNTSQMQSVVFCVH
jgi:hypothetical protein